MPSSLMRKMVEDDVLLVWQWRNNVSVRQYMFNNAEISEEKHHQWFLEMSIKDNQHLLIFENNGKALGFVSFSIKVGGIAEWGFYKAPNAPGGTGSKLGVTALNYAFTKLGLYKINAQVISFNRVSIRFHKKLNFTHEGIIRHGYFDGETYHNIENFGLIASEWIVS